MTTRLQVDRVVAVEAQGGGDGPSVNSPSTAQEFVEIEYPMTVKNEDKYLASLGGEAKLQATLNDPQRRLELRFRPDDLWAHGTFADRLPSNSMWVRFKRFKRVKKKPVASKSIGSSKPSASVAEKTESDKKGGNDGDVPDKEGYHYSAQLMGVIRHAYKFNCLADFQFLPIERTDTGTSKEGAEYRYIANSIIPPNPFKNPDDNLKDDPLKTFANCAAPSFIQPSIFSRFDAPKDYYYQDNPGYKQKTDTDESLKGIIGTDRKSRKIPGFQLKATDETPAAPDPQLVEMITRNKKFKMLYEQIMNMFEQRPVWSKNAIMYYLKADRVELRSVLPAAAYYFTSGPFRCLWVKFGYDPRKDPSALKYQALDFRLRHSYVRPYNLQNSGLPQGDEQKTETLDNNEQVPEVLDNSIVAKRSIYSQTLSITKSRATDSPNFSNKKGGEDETKKLDFIYRSFVFKAGLIPSCRQLFYQLCDIELDTVQNLLRITQPLDNCDVENDGWLPEKTLDKIRDLMMVVVTKYTPEKKRSWPRKRNKKEQLEKLDSSLQEEETTENSQTPQDDSMDYVDEEDSLGMEFDDTFNEKK